MLRCDANVAASRDGLRIRFCSIYHILSARFFNSVLQYTRIDICMEIKGFGLSGAQPSDSKPEFQFLEAREGGRARSPFLAYK